VVGLSYIRRDESAMNKFDSTSPADGKDASSERNIERHAVAIKMSNDQKVPTGDAYYEAVASQEEIYLEETEEELRAIFTSDDSPPHNATSEYWRRKREQLELGWRTEIDDRRK
jgi:hypothetical protein